MGPLISFSVFRLLLLAEESSFPFPCENEPTETHFLVLFKILGLKNFGIKVVNHFFRVFLEVHSINVQVHEVNLNKEQHGNVVHNYADYLV